MGEAEIKFLLFIGLPLVLFLLTWIASYFIKLRQRLLKNFVMNNSRAIKELIDINSQTDFLDVSVSGMEHSFDNEIFFDSVSPLDYLTYQLVYEKKNFNIAINNARTNAKNYTQYNSRVSAISSFGIFEASKLPAKIQKINNLEKKLFSQNTLRPCIGFSIPVKIWRTNIQGIRLTVKSANFNMNQIEEIIKLLNQKNGDFYLNPAIWDSICRVERAKVSNRLRFAIYERDGHRCRKCGRYSNNLEIDHIYPISKGGKSTIDNLQTLCHDCNVKKSNTIESGVVSPRYGRRVYDGLCPNCKVNLILKKGRHGEFFACPNYPSCKYTKR